MLRLRLALRRVVMLAASGLLFLSSHPSDAFVSSLSSSVHRQRALYVPTHQEAIDSVTWSKPYSSGEFNHSLKDKRIKRQQQKHQHPYQQTTTLLNRLPTAFSRRFFFHASAEESTIQQKLSQSKALSALTPAATHVTRWSLLLTAAACFLVNAQRWPSAITLLQQALAWYVVQLEAHPLLTKSLTSGAIGLAGDCLAQSIDRFVKRRRGGQSLKYDRRRGLSVLLEGLLISGPTMHVGYDLFERILPTTTATGHSSVAAMLHVVADSVLLDSFFIGTAFVMTGLMEGYRIKQIANQLKSDYTPTLIASWITSTSLMPIEFLAFRFLPVSLRVLAVKFIDVIWDTVISFMTHRSRSHGADDVEVASDAALAAANPTTAATFPPLAVVEPVASKPPHGVAYAM